MQTVPHPTEIRLDASRRLLKLSFDDGSVFELTSEFLRVYSRSAEVKGHGPGEGILQIGKENVEITAVEPVGNYAVKLIFDDGHDTGLYSFKYLYQLSRDREAMWQSYLDRLKAAGHIRSGQSK